MKKLFVVFVGIFCVFLGGVDLVSAVGGGYSLGKAMDDNFAAGGGESRNDYVPDFLPSTDAELDGEVGDVTSVVQKIINVIIVLVGVGAVIVVIYAGGVLMLSVGNADQITNGKKTLIWAGVGLVVVIFAYVLAKTVISFTYIDEGGGVRVEDGSFGGSSGVGGAGDGGDYVMSEQSGDDVGSVSAAPGRNVRRGSRSLREDLRGTPADGLHDDFDIESSRSCVEVDGNGCTAFVGVEDHVISGMNALRQWVIDDVGGGAPLYSIIYGGSERRGHTGRSHHEGRAVDLDIGPGRSDNRWVKFILKRTSTEKAGGHPVYRLSHGNYNYYILLEDGNAGHLHIQPTEK